MLKDAYHRLVASLLPSTFHNSTADPLLTVSSLSNQRTDEQLQHSVQEKFSIWGECYVKIRRDKNKMPLAFVSYPVRITTRSYNV